MNDREKILLGIHLATSGFVAEKPDLKAIRRQSFQDPFHQVEMMIRQVGGETVRAQGTALRAQVDSMFPELEVFYAIESGLDVFECRQVDVLVVAGEFAVAENGAVWVDGWLRGEQSSVIGHQSSVNKRSLLFLAEHLVLVVPASEVVNTMHEGYERLKGRDFGYGTFISGPSKTADIEQALVVGAQGPKRCTVIFTD